MALFTVPLVLSGQTSGLTPGVTTGSEWRHIGNAAMELGLAALASGPVNRVWYSDDGQRLFARTRSGRVLVTDDFEHWSGAKNAIEPIAAPLPGRPNAPESGAQLRQTSRPSRLYALGKSAYRSEDDGATWTNLTQYRGSNLLGDVLTDIAASPRDPDEITVASSEGVWRSLDGGMSWSGLNQSLPNLPVRKIAGLPTGTRGTRISLSGPGSVELEWHPGQKAAWGVVQNSGVAQEDSLRSTLSRRFGVSITAVTLQGAYMYAGSAEGQIWSSSDQGATWEAPLDRLGSAVEAFYIDPKDPRIALAALGAHNPSLPGRSKNPHVLKTMNGGIFWDDWTANLSDAAAHGVTADPSSGAIYVASDAGVFLSISDLASAGSPANWTLVSSKLPGAAAMDVKLDASGSQLFVALDGPGVYATIAPHRFRDPRVVNAADLTSRASAPGGLLSVMGARVQSAQSGSTTVPVLDANDTASQIQVPFDAKGSALSLSLQTGSTHYNVGVALKAASPAIFVDPDGAPLVLDAESGVLLDSSKPARAKTRIQILATGLGRVTPEFPAGVAAPISDPPRVAAPVHVYLDTVPLEVKQAILAPGYIGFYLIEVELPAFVNAGASDLSIEAEGQDSNHVRIYVVQ